jgi:hypothetical protein
MEMTSYLIIKIILSCYLLVHGFAPFMVVPTPFGESGSAYGDVYMVDGHGEGYFYLTWMIA